RPSGGDGAVIEAGDVKVDLAKRTVEVRGEEVRLTFVEFELLRVLAASPGRVFSRRQLLERLRGDADYREPRTIDVHVRHLREKIERDAREPELILTVRGVGYRFRDRP
ncbi:MAG TPA: winged helix-turn-helix domain-containing protein, partial [Gaiellaceae bacterium]|nr:winged helix-turn-helix domain-containing protein [Gaiellaceae bacterium]